jgi:hypothetical protein
MNNSNSTKQGTAIARCRFFIRGFRFRVLTGFLLLPLLLAALGAPAQAFGATGSSSQYSVTLAWNPSPDTNVVGYRVYYGGNSGIYTNETDVGNMTSNTVSGLTGSVPYYFAVTAYDVSGLESAFSGGISYTPAIPTVQLSVTPGNQFVLTMNGQIGHTYNLQATQNFNTWTNIGIATLGASGSLQFTDFNAASYPYRFYRIQDTQP